MSIKGIICMLFIISVYTHDTSRYNVQYYTYTKNKRLDIHATIPKLMDGKIPKIVQSHSDVLQESEII